MDESSPTVGGGQAHSALVPDRDEGATDVHGGRGHSNGEHGPVRVRMEVSDDAGASGYGAEIVASAPAQLREVATDEDRVPVR